MLGRFYKRGESFFICMGMANRLKSFTNLQCNTMACVQKILKCINKTKCNKKTRNKPYTESM